MTESIIKGLIYFHAACGGVALICGAIALSTKKGGKIHRLAGKIFFAAMVVVTLLALFVAIQPNHKSSFLFIVGIFSLYMVASGYRMISIKNNIQNVKWFDWGISLVMALFAIVFLIFGIKSIWLKEYGGIVLLVFGVISLRMAYSDFRFFSGKLPDKKTWLFFHIQKMTGGYIAATTAFLVVNNKILPGVVAWLLPTLIGTPLIFYFIGKYRK